MRRRALRQLAAALTGALAFLSPAGGTESDAPEEQDKTSYRILVCPAQFQDLEFQCTDKEIETITLRAAEYLNAQFRGTRVFSFTLAPVITLPESFAYYGANVSYEKDVRIPEAVSTIIKEIPLKEAEQEPSKKARNGEEEGDGDPEEPEQPGVVLADFDNDADGTIDLVCFIFAGSDESQGGQPEDIWPQFRRLSIEGLNLSRSGLKIDNYTVSTEACGFAVFCHELLHSFGLSDLYDTDDEGSGGRSAALWGTSIMDRGDKDGRETPPNLNAMELLQLGLGQCDTLRTGEYSLSPIHRSGRYLRFNTDVENEFFLFECRKAEGWDSGLGGSGMLIYHVDMSTNEAGFSDFYKVPLNAYERWKFNQVNTNPEHQCVDLIEADPETEDISRIFFPAGSTSFRAGGSPSFRFWSGKTADIAIENIRLSGDGSISFTASTPLALDTLEIYQDAVTLRWTCSGRGGCDIVLDGETVAEGINPYKESEYCFTIEGLEPRSSHTVRIESETNEISTAFTTAPFHRGSYPFIYLRNAERTPEGLFVKGSSLALRVYNAPSRPVEWFFNGQPVRTGPDGRFRLETSGTLKAEVLFEDGAKDVITKKINVR